MMRRFLSGVLQFIGIVALIIMLTLFYLYQSGALSPQKLSMIGKILRGQEIYTAAPIRMEPKAEWDKLKWTIEQKDRSLRRREQDIIKVEASLKLQLQEIQEKRRELELQWEQLKREQKRLELARRPPKEEQLKNFRANVERFNKMDSETVVSIIQDWDAKRIREYLRELKLAKAAEIIRLLSENPKFTTPNQDGVRKLDIVLGESME
jgi:alanyl-tRNA synthetase